MTALAISLLWKALPFIVGIIVWLGGRFFYERKGAAKERAKREAADRMVEDLADEVESDIGVLTPEQRREELRKWAR